MIPSPWWLLAAPLIGLVVAGGWAKARSWRRGRTARRCHGQMDLVGRWRP